VPVAGFINKRQQEPTLRLSRDYLEEERKGKRGTTERKIERIKVKRYNKKERWK
jgi:hypothetical protein